LEYTKKSNSNTNRSRYINGKCLNPKKKPVTTAKVELDLSFGFKAKSKRVYCGAKSDLHIHMQFFYSFTLVVAALTFVKT